MSTKKIGFIDLYISEWHANNYPAWIKRACEEFGYDYSVAYAWAEDYVSPTDGRNTDEWCEAFGVERCNTIEEICEKSDVLVILSPSRADKHLEYAKIAFTYGKPTYIDKPFSDSIENAKEIFALSEKYSVPFFSSSALRYASELNEADECIAMSTMGGGRALEEYMIHQAEMVVKKLGMGAKAVKAQRISDYHYTFAVRYDDERRAAMHYVKASMPFLITMGKGIDENAVFKQVKSDFFYDLIADMLRFFETGSCSFNTEETLEVTRILVASIKAKASPDQWIEI